MYDGFLDNGFSGRDVFGGLFFAKQSINAEDIIKALVPDYYESTGDERQRQEVVLRREKDSEKNVGLLVDILRYHGGQPAGQQETGLADFEGIAVESQKENNYVQGNDFLRQFLLFVTGSDLVPFSKFRITVEFYDGRHKGVEQKMAHNAVPESFTCVETLKLPHHAYNGDGGILHKKLLEAVMHCGTFSMQ